MLDNWYWYSARENELFIDVDHFQHSIGHIRKRLQGACESERLHIHHVNIFPSLTDDHFHIIITLFGPILDMERFAWEVILHSDIYRACSNIMRSINHVPNPDILIGRKKYHRLPDAICNCDAKHTAAVMEKCPAAIKLRGADRVRGFFGKPSNNPCAFL